MALITLSELKAVLGIGDIYADALVQECADAAENILLGLLTKNQWGVIAHSRTNLVNTIYTDRPHDVYVGQSVEIANCGQNFNGTKTITKVTEYSMEFAGSGADYPKHGVIPYGTVSAHQYIDYDTIPEVREAALAIASDIWITRTGTLGQQGVDFQSPAPYRLGRSLFTRVSGLLGKWMDTRGMVG
jgi:hypothetical protein